MYILRDLKWNREQVKRKTFFKRRKIFEWQKGIRLPRGRAAQEAKAAPEMMQHELELSTAECQEDRAGSWLRYLGQSLSTAGGSSFIFCGSAQALDRKDMGTWSSAISGWYVFSEIRLYSTPASPGQSSRPQLSLFWGWFGPLLSQLEVTKLVASAWIRAAPPCQQLLGRSLLHWWHISSG